MNRYIPDNILDEIRTRSDIVEVIDSYVPLKKAGVSWQACCPFHQEKTPSFKVNPEKQIYHCFGCGKGGNVFTFVMETEGVDFPEAARILASKCGVIIPENESPAQVHDPGGISRERLYSLHEDLAAWFEENLWQHPETPVYRHFYERKIPIAAAKKFGIGASPDSWDAALNWAKSRGYSEKELLAAGIVLESQNSQGRIYDRFRNRLMFPIWNDQGRVVAFSGRAVEKDIEGAKYVNSPETQIFRKSSVLYALPLARQAINQLGFVILCEGQLDVLAMHRADYENSVAPQGTAFTDEQARKLKRLTNRIYIAFDSDSAGIKAAARAVEITLSVDFEVKIIEFPEKQDPDEIFKNEGPEGIKKLVKNASDFFDFLLRMFSRQYDASSPVGKGRIVEEMVNYINKLHNTVIRSSYASELAGRLNIPESAVFRELNKHRTRSKVNPASSIGNSSPASSPMLSYESMDKKILDAEESLLKLALAHGTVGKRLESDLPAEMLSDTPLGHALEKVVLMTINGEWEFAEETLIKEMDETPDPLITKAMADAAEYSHSIQEKTVDDCIRTIKFHYIQKDIDEIKRKIAAAEEREAKAELLAEFQKKSKELLELGKK
jgi:DNA primase